MVISTLLTILSLLFKEGKVRINYEDILYIVSIETDSEGELN